MVVLLMGVAGSGKTTVGSMLAAELGWSFYDADDFHPPVNVAKMRSGRPLDDADRLPWLDAIRDRVRTCEERGENAVIACSALKHSYREHIIGNSGAKLVHLEGDPDLIRARLEQRVGHYMSAAMLDSQFAALEEPAGVLHLNVAASPPELVRTIRAHLGV